jgi:hypothetical protein
MVEGTKSAGSVSITNSDCKNDKIEKNIATSAFLFNNEGNFAWKGDLPTLKVFVYGIIKHLKCKDGKWSSPREKEKMFKCPKFILKWFGKKKEKLVIMKDNEEKSLQSTLATCAQTKGIENQQETTKHVADAIEYVCSHSMFTPRPRTEAGKRSFGYRGAVLWNDLPDEIRSQASIFLFKNKLSNFQI